MGGSVPRWVRLALVVAALALLALAGVSRWLLMPRLEALPLNGATTHARASDGIVGDPTTGSQVRTDLTITNRSRPVSVGSARQFGNDVAVFDLATTGRGSDGRALFARHDRLAVDRRDRQAAPCCPGQAGATGGRAKHGYVLSFPPDVGKRNYPLWDPILAKALPVQFATTDSVNGLPTYVFVQNIPPTAVARDRVPARIVKAGLTGTATVDRVYTVRRRIWVEPRTGTIVQRREQAETTLRAGGRTIMTVYAADSRYDAATVRSQVALAGPWSRRLALTGDILPLVAGVLGLLALGIGLTARPSSDRPTTVSAVPAVPAGVRS
ncbi:DUF3068 domain-containing protein [Actinopolymorpha alba]|uniref:DUF3068 domain-containing protein n=1 Tax=Actinopolymorpha alba TaxID=533267 RepID=UPI0003633A4E|nr:DUF3068 domain-containing protein [Actinopolymorpha alba]